MNGRRRVAVRGLYALTPGGRDPETVLDWARRVLAGGAVWLQVRDKPAPAADLARRLAALCREHGATCIVNDDPALAGAVGADGVHLGRDDASVAEAREILGPDARIGVSCYADLERARRAVSAGADYVAFGSLFPSSTKPEAVACPPELLGRARAFDVPVVAIGGITPDRAPALIDAGADLLAVVSDLADAPDPEARAREYARLFE